MTDYDPASPVLYNGNIAETLWRSRTDDQLRMYSYRYDNMNRLTDGFYMNRDATTQNGRYDEKDISYDKNGNIQSLNRVGLKQQSPTAQYDIIDALGYIYPQYSNRLERVKDTGGTVGYKDGGYNVASDADFRYDSNGNMTHDFAKNLGTPTTRGITYNHLNLPITVLTLSNTVSVPANIKKLTIRIDNNGGGTIWYDDVVIRRVTAPASEIVEESNYYPFGMKQEGYNNIVQTTRNIPAQRYKYQGQERQDELGLNWDSFKWRNYDYALGRFMSIDPLAEDYVYNSPYAFQENKLGLGRELEGLEMVSERSKDGKSVTVTIKMNITNSTSG